MNNGKQRAGRDPRKAGYTPPFPPQEQEAPGHEAQMSPRPDHGERTYVGHGKLKDKVALITGADSGIGRALAFAREGADVAIGYLSEGDDARETERLVRQAPGPAGRAGARLRVPGLRRQPLHDRRGHRPHGR